jgi:DNA-binding Lrp family transcriptional regulator
MLKIRSESGAKSWTFFNNHAHVLICIARDASLTLREISYRVGITERAVQLIIKDLEECGALAREKQGRCNTYIINLHYPLRHPLESNHTIEEILSVLISPEELEGIKVRTSIEV